MNTALVLRDARTSTSLSFVLSVVRCHAGASSPIAYRLQPTFDAAQIAPAANLPRSTLEITSHHIAGLPVFAPERGCRILICLADAVRQGTFAKAYLVLGGEGWKLRSFFVGGGLKSYLVDADKVDLLTLESFVARANQGKL